MTLGQMRVLISVAGEAIDNYAAGNDAFDKLRDRERSDLEFREAELGLGLTAFEFRIGNEHYAVVLNDENEVVHSMVDRKR